MKADLEILARELKNIAEGEWLLAPEGFMTWAEGWLLSLAELGITPAPFPPARDEKP